MLPQTYSEALLKPNAAESEMPKTRRSSNLFTQGSLFFNKKSGEYNYEIRETHIFIARRLHIQLTSVFHLVLYNLAFPTIQKIYH